MNNMKQNYAFISYSHRDITMAKWLHKKLESYKLPTEIHNDFENSRYLRPIFRDQEDLNTGVLSDELRKQLDNSKFLIVVCSPHSAQSQWVSEEVKFFIESGRLEYIIPFIIEGTPGSDGEPECLPLSLRQFISNHPDRELLGINIAEVGREKSFIRVVSRMLGVSFDNLWKRHERDRRRKLISWSIGTVLTAFLVYCFFFPVSLTLELQDEEHHLPVPEDAVLVVNGASYPLSNLDTTITITGLPSHFKYREIPVSFSATYYSNTDSCASSHLSFRAHMILPLKRDKTFAIFAGKVIDEHNEPVSEATVQIGDTATQSSNDGTFKISFKAADQSEIKPVKISKTGKKTIFREDECPGEELIYILHNQ